MNFLQRVILLLVPFLVDLGDADKPVQKNTTAVVQVDKGDTELLHYVDHYYGSGKRGGGVNFCYTKPKCLPKQWAGTCSTGLYQSPVNLARKFSSKAKQAGGILGFGTGYKNPITTFFITNNAHTVLAQVTTVGTSSAVICHRDVEKCFKFSQMHFHWAAKDAQGSEHTVDNKHFPLEIHLVHYNQQYKELGAAFKSHDVNAAAVVAIFVKVGKFNPDLVSIINETQKHALKPMDGMKKVTGSINLSKLLPAKRSFYRYSGSLTVPPCTEKILWAVMETPIEISKEQMAAFRKITTNNEASGHMENYRPPQPLNGRIIEYFSS